jgi:hypothetical protein
MMATKTALVQRAHSWLPDGGANNLERCGIQLRIQNVPRRGPSVPPDLQRDRSTPDKAALLCRLGLIVRRGAPDHRRDPQAASGVYSLTAGLASGIRSVRYRWRDRFGSAHRFA